MSQPGERIRIGGNDCDMSGRRPEDLTVAGLVTPLEGCGADGARAAVVDAYGRELHVIGVRRNGLRVELVVDTGATGPGMAPSGNGPRSA